MTFPAEQTAPAPSLERGEQILIWAPWERDAAVLARVLRETGFACLVCASAEDLVEEATHGAGAVLLTEEGLTEDAVTVLCQMLDAQPHWSDLPLVVLCRTAPARSPSFTALDTHRVTLLEQPVPVLMLASVLHSALRARQHQYEVRDLHAQLEQRVEERTRQVRRLVEALTLAEQQERKRIAHVLHDDLQQILYGLGITLKMLREPQSEAEEATLRDQADQTLDRAVETTRTLSDQLSPPVLGSGDLEQLLQWIALRKEDQYGLQVDIEMTSPCCDLASDVLVLVYQFLRELLFNVLKHAGTNQALVKAHEEEGTFFLQVIDEGKGFDAETVMSTSGPTGGLGLLDIRERVRLIGGRLTVESSPGAGTRVVIAVPVEAGRV